ncbi:hypothetical protein BDZ89DRAFT_1070408 [Hymenopellis radicata]|nr:hypothetical protein BDZ89DRAFT_1070408 [Hymenopellis radicata]
MPSKPSKLRPRTQRMTGIQIHAHTIVTHIHTPLPVPPSCPSICMLCPDTDFNAIPYPDSDSDSDSEDEDDLDDLGMPSDIECQFVDALAMKLSRSLRLDRMLSPAILALAIASGDALGAGRLHADIHGVPRSVAAFEDPVLLLRMESLAIRE